MVDVESIYSPFAPPIDYDTSDIFVIDPILEGIIIERPSRPSNLVSNFQFYQQNYYSNYNLDNSSIYDETNETTVIQSQLFF